MVRGSPSSILTIALLTHPTFFRSPVSLAFAGTHGLFQGDFSEMIKLLDTLHRWTGGLIGLLLALMGLSGTVLLSAHLWIGLPDAGDPLRGHLATVAPPTAPALATAAPPGTPHCDDVEAGRRGG